jgi:hypothetical protein
MGHLPAQGAWLYMDYMIGIYNRLLVVVMEGWLDAIPFHSILLKLFEHESKKYYVTFFSISVLHKVRHIILF